MSTKSPIATLPRARRVLPGGPPQELDAAREALFNVQAIVELIALASESIPHTIHPTVEKATENDLHAVKRAARVAVSMIDDVTAKLELVGASA